MSRVAIVGGCRTPFVRAGGKFAGYSFLDLGEHAVKSLINRLSLDPKLIDEIVYSTVLLDPRYPNAAREIVFRSGMSLRTPAHFISNNCISGLVAINMIAEGILSNRLAVGIAGGSESMSQPALALRKSAEKFWIAMGAARSLGARLQILQTFRPRMLLPIPPSPKEPSTGLTMGEHCEITAKEFGIRRETQDHIALRSHSNAAKAEANQYLADEIVPLGSVTKDNLIRG
ncbi:MAG: hypothetical protein KDD42_07920, partial [Bdellovibrionales bacterium]|nr:hypothetical protein [Bdellovibrionales bacterium]